MIARQSPLHYSPPMKPIWMGIGCDRDCDPALAAHAALEALAQAECSPAQLRGLGSVALKSDEKAIHDLAHEWGIPLHFFPAERLEQETPRLANPSTTVFAHTGCHGVAEAAALALAGPDAVLILPKFKSHNVTIALAGPP